MRYDRVNINDLIKSCSQTNSDHSTRYPPSTLKKVFAVYFLSLLTAKMFLLDWFKMRASRLLTSVRLLRLNSNKVQCPQIQSGLCSTSYSTLSPILCYNLPTLSTHNLLSPAPFSTGNVLGKKTADELFPDTEVYLVDHKDNRTPIKYAELQAKVRQGEKSILTWIFDQ